MLTYFGRGFVPKIKKSLPELLGKNISDLLRAAINVENSLQTDGGA